MLYERPRLIILSGKAWDAAGVCSIGGSNFDGACTIGVHAFNGDCVGGNVPQASSSCSFGDGDADQCKPGGNAAGGTPTCADGFAPQGTGNVQCVAGSGVLP